MKFEHSRVKGETISRPRVSIIRIINTQSNCANEPQGVPLLMLARGSLHSPDATGLSVHALPAIVDSSTAPVNSRSRPRAVPGTRCTRRSPIIAVPDGREGARPASRLRLVPPRERVSLPPVSSPLLSRHAQTPPRLSRRPSPPEFRLNPAHLSLINR